MFVLCAHLTSTTVDCSTNPAPGTPCVAVCRNSSGSAIRARINNIHSPSHGRLVDAGTPPVGITAVFDFEDDTTLTQSPGTAVYSDWVPYSGGPVTIRFYYEDSNGQIQSFDLASDAPMAC